MESSRHDEALIAALGALRPSPDPAFAAELDERAAAGFPRRESSGAAPWARLLAWLRERTPRQVLLPSAATALIAVLVATVIVAGGSSGTSSLNDEVTSSGTAVEESSGAASEGETLGKLSQEPAIPEASAGAGSAAEAEATIAPSADSAKVGGPSAKREIERSAEIVLGAEPEQVSDAAAEVFAAVHAAHGIVLRSAVQEGTEGEAGASFDLLIPSGRLDDALGAFSEIGDVLSRRDGSADITAPTVGASERLQDSQAKIEALLNDLAASGTELERETLEAELSFQRQRAAFLRSQLEALQRRASLAHVSLQIESTAAAQGSGGGWDVGDAAGDAGQILAVAAGVALIGLAVLAPIALIALLIWLGHRVWVGQSRRRALG